MSALKYSYHEERGEFHGYVEDEMGNVIYEMHYPEFYEDDETGELIESSTIFEDGFMQDADDTEGLIKYLLSMRLINEDDEVIHESEYKSNYNDGGLTSGAYGQGTSLLEEGGEMERGGYVSKGELVWRKLSNPDRTNFLKENFTPEITPMSQHTLVRKDFNFLPKKVKIKLEAKYANVEEYATGGEMDIEEEDKEENEIEEHLQSISDVTGIPVDVLRSYVDVFVLDYKDLTNDIPYNGAFGTQEDFAEHLVDNGLITDLSNYLYMTDLDIRILAGEEADARLDGMDDEDIAELAGKSDEYEELKDDLDRLEELKDEIEELEEEIKEMRDEFDTYDATEEETEKFDEKIKDKENELADLKDENETLGNRVEYASIEDFIDDIRDDALSNANDEITEELEKDAVGYFENLGYSQQDLANHSLFSIDYEKLAEKVSYDFVFIEGEDGDYHIFDNYADGGAIPEGYHQMPDGTIMPDSAHLEHGGDVAESNLHMLMNQAEQFEHHAKELQEALSKNPRVDAWVVAKAERAATDLSDITHYLEGENNIHTNGDGEDVIKMDVPLFIRSQEYAREDAKSDADLHEFTDNAIDLSQSGETLEMDDYKNLVPNHMAKGGVIASSTSKEGIQKLISEYYYGSKITLNKVGDAYEVSNAKGRVKGVKVVEKNGRYQFVNDTKMMARGGVNFGASFEKFKKQVLPINIETRSEVDANTILKYADLQNVPATLKSIGDLFVVILDKPLEIRDSMEGRIKELLEGKSYAKGGGLPSIDEIREKGKWLGDYMIDESYDVTYAGNQENYEYNGKTYFITTWNDNAQKHDDGDETLEEDYTYYNASDSYAKGGKFEVDSTYTHFAVGKKDGKIVTGWEYKDLDKEDIKRFTDMDLKDMDFNPKDFRILTTRFLKSQGIDPFDWSNWKKTSEFAKGGGIEKKEYLDEYLKKIGVDKNELPARALRYHTKMANKKYEKERLNDLPYKKYLVTYKIPFGAILSKVVDARTHNEAKINFRKEHGGKDFQGNVNKILKVSLTKVKKEDGGEMARGGKTDVLLKFVIPDWAMSAIVNDDRSGLYDEDIERLDNFLDSLVKKYGNANLMLGDVDGKDDLGLGFRNDIDGNLVSNSFRMYLRPTKDYARGGETNKFEIYHDTLSSALEEVEDYAKKNGYDIIGDYFPDVKVGGINYGETKRFSLPVNKQGKKNDGKIMIQIYRMGSGRYELNMYPTYAKGGATFDDKVKAISTSLEGKEVPKRLSKDYGKKYNKKEALEAARRIAGSMRAKEMKKGKK